MAKTQTTKAPKKDNLKEAAKALNTAADYLEKRFTEGGSIEMVYKVRANDARRLATRIS